MFFTSAGGTAARTLSVVTVDVGPSFVAGKPAVITKLSPSASFAYDVAPDGRFLFHVAASESNDLSSRPQLVIVQHWFDELKARVPISKQD